MEMEDFWFDVIMTWFAWSKKIDSILFLSCHSARLLTRKMTSKIKLLNIKKLEFDALNVTMWLINKQKVCLFCPSIGFDSDSLKNGKIVSNDLFSGYSVLLVQFFECIRTKKRTRIDRCNLRRTFNGHNHNCSEIFFHFKFKYNENKSKQK